MLAGAYSKRFRKLQDYQVEKLKILNASYEECVNRNNGETANITGKARRLSQETNKRRKVLALRRKQESQKEEKRRQEILLHRRLLQQEATERFQRAPLQNRNRKGASCPNTPLEDVLQIIRGETPSKTTKPLRSNSAKLQKEVQFGSTTITTKPPIHTPSHLLYLFNSSERAVALCNHKNLKGMVNNRNLFEQQLRRHQQQPVDQGMSPASREELNSDSDQSVSSNETNKKKCKLPSSAVNENTSAAIIDHITKHKKVPLVGNDNKIPEEQHSLNGNERTCEAISEGNDYGDCPYNCNISDTKQGLPLDLEPSTNVKWPTHKSAQLVSAANVKPITAWSSPGNHSKNDKKMNGTVETCNQFEDYCQMENACTRDTKWPQNSIADPNNLPLSGGRTWTVSKHNIYERQLSNFSNTHSSSKTNEPASENQYTDNQSNVALQNGCNSITHKTAENSKRNVSSTYKNTVTNTATLATQQYSAANFQSTRQTSANNHQAVRQNSANNHQAVRQTSANNHQAVRQNSANNHQAVRQNSANNHQTVKQNSANTYQVTRQNSSINQELKHNLVNPHHTPRQNSITNCQTRWNSVNHQAKHEMSGHVTGNKKISKTGSENPTTVVVSNQKKQNSTCTELKYPDNDNGDDSSDNDDDDNNYNNNNDNNNYKPILPCCYITPKVIVRKKLNQASEETLPGNKNQKQPDFQNCHSNVKNLEANCKNSEDVIAEKQANFTKKNGKSVRSILKHQTNANINQSAIPFQLRDSLEITRLHYSTNQKENTGGDEKPTKKHVHFAMENILSEKHLQAPNTDRDKIAGFVVDNPLATDLECKDNHTNRYQDDQSGTVNENQENQYRGRPSAKAFIITQSTVDNNDLALTSTCNETVVSGKPAYKKPGVQHITMGKLKNMFTSPIPFPSYNSALWNISNQTGNKKPASNLNERRKPTSGNEVSLKPPMGIHVDKTPTDEDINLVWQKVKSCFKQKSTYRQQHQYHHHQLQQQLQVKYQQQQQQQQLQCRQQLAVNTQPNPLNGQLLNNKMADWSLSAIHRNGINNFSCMEKSDNYLRRLAFLQQKAKQQRHGHSNTNHNNNNNNDNDNYNNNSHYYYDGTLTKAENSNGLNKMKPVPSANTHVRESLAAFLTAEDYSKLLNVTDRQTMAAMNHAAEEQQMLNRRQLHIKGPTILSLEEQRLMKSLERINNKLKASRITKYQ